MKVEIEIEKLSKEQLVELIKLGAFSTKAPQQKADPEVRVVRTVIENHKSPTRIATYLDKVKYVVKNRARPLKFSKLRQILKMGGTTSCRVLEALKHDKDVVVFSKTGVRGFLVAKRGYKVHSGKKGNKSAFLTFLSERTGELMGKEKLPYMKAVRQAQSEWKAKKATA